MWTMRGTKCLKHIDIPQTGEVLLELGDLSRCCFDLLLARVLPRSHLGQMKPDSAAYIGQGK
jgi:hypothetical protein